MNGPSTSQPPPILPASTGVAAFVDVFAGGSPDVAMTVDSFGEFETTFGGLSPSSAGSYAVWHFFLNGGRKAVIVPIASLTAEACIGSPSASTGLFALDRADAFDLLAVPGASGLPAADALAVFTAAEAYCEAHRAFLLVDPPPTVVDPPGVQQWLQTNAALRHRSAALYFPHLIVSDPLQPSVSRSVGPSGAMAGALARTDATRGVWMPAAGALVALAGVTGLEYHLSEADMFVLTPQAINGLLHLEALGFVPWGVRTLAGADGLDHEWKYITVRRLGLFIERSVDQGVRWAAFEPNDQPLWTALQQSVETFLHSLWLQGAFKGATPRDAYFARCGRDTTTAEDLAAGRLNVVIGFAPLRPAEFVNLQVAIHAGQIPP